MKELLVLFSFLILYSCNSDQSHDRLLHVKSIETDISDNKDIFGTWTMCSSSSNGAMIQPNTCQTIVFNSNGTGYIENNAIATENFNWTLKMPGMKIHYPKNLAKQTFPDTTYYVDFSKRDNRIDLILRHNDNSYYLSK